MAVQPIITELNKKTDGNTFVRYPIGTEPHLVGSQRNSNNNNLEEQLMIGTDNSATSIVTLVGSGASQKAQETETINFKVSSSDDKYYTLTKVTQRDLSTTVDAANKKLNINLSPKVYSQVETLQYHVKENQAAEGEEPDIQDVVKNVSTKTLTITQDASQHDIYTYNIQNQIPTS